MSKGSRTIKHVTSKYDFSLILLVLFLCFFGLVMVFSTSYYNADHYYHEDELYFKKQLEFIIIGFVIMILISQIDYHIWAKKIKNKISLTWLFYIVATVLQYAILFVGSSSNGSARWIDLGGGIRFQPSEITKIMIVVSGAAIIKKMRNSVEKIPGLLVCMVLLGIPLVPVMLQNLSSAIIIAAMYCGMSFVVSRNKKIFLIVILIGGILLFAMINLKGYRGDRISGWQDVEAEGGSQILQGLYAIASGGMFGKGLGNSTMKQATISEVHTDMIFSVICEELGIIGGIMLIALFLVLLWKIFSIAQHAPDIYGSLVATAVFIHIAIQTWIHIAVVTASMPATGATLPFVSYGGSSLMMMMAEMGFVLSVSKYTYAETAEQQAAMEEGGIGDE